MSVQDLTATDKQLIEVRDLSLKIITTAPAITPPSEAARAAATYVMVCHMLDHHSGPEATAGIDPALITLSIANGDQAITAMKHRVKELEAAALAAEEGTNR